MSIYPEHDKLAALKGENDVVGDFLEWLQSRNMVIHEWREDLTDVVPCEHPGVETYRLTRLAARESCTRCDNNGLRTIHLEPRFVAVSGGIRDMLGRYFDIDQEKLSAEKDAMLLALRSQVPA